MCSYCLPNPRSFCKIRCSLSVQCYLVLWLNIFSNQIAYDESTAWCHVQGCQFGFFYFWKKAKWNLAFFGLFWRIRFFMSIWQVSTLWEPGYDIFILWNPPKTSSCQLPYQHPSSSADCARELFKGSNGSDSLLDCTRKNFWLRVADFLWVTS